MREQLESTILPILLIAGTSFLMETAAAIVLHFIGIAPKAMLVGAVLGSIWIGWYGKHWCKQPFWYRLSVALMSSVLGWMSTILLFR